MACLKNLRTDLLSSSPAPDPGGSWTFDGFLATAGTPSAGTNGSPSVTEVGVGPLGPSIYALSGDNPQIDPTGAEAGFYYFTYTLPAGSCGSPATVQTYLEVKEAPDVGGNFTKNVCTGDPVFTIYTEWDNNGNAPPLAIAQANAFTGGSGVGAAVHVANLGGRLDDDDFDPSQGNDGDTYTFELTLTTPGGSGCPDCTETAIVTVNITASPAAGTASPQTVCN